VDEGIRNSKVDEGIRSSKLGEGIRNSKLGEGTRGLRLGRMGTGNCYGARRSKAILEEEDTFVQARSREEGGRVVARTGHMAAAAGAAAAAGQGWSGMDSGTLLNPAGSNGDGEE